MDHIGKNWMVGNIGQKGEVMKKRQFLHGLSADSGMFQPQIGFFKDRYQVIAPDLRGNGQSSQLTCQADQVLDISGSRCWRFWKEKTSAALHYRRDLWRYLTMHLMTQNPHLKGAFLCDTFCAT